MDVSLYFSTHSFLTGAIQQPVSYDSRLMKFSFDPSSKIHFEDIQAIRRQQAKCSIRVLEIKIKNPSPFVCGRTARKGPTGGVGRTPIRWCWISGVSRDLARARPSLSNDSAANQKGCVLDAITLSLVRRLGMRAAVRSVCGPMAANSPIRNGYFCLQSLRRKSKRRENL